MGIETRAKRASCIGMGLLFLPPNITPNGNDLDVADRQQAMGYFSAAAFDGDAMYDVVEFTASINPTEAIAATIHRVEAWQSEF